MEVQALARKRLAARAEAVQGEAKAAAAALLAEAAAAPGAQQVAGGLVFRPLAEGTGPSPRLADAVQVRFTGRLAGGKVFDATPAGAAPARFKLEQVTPCWAEALQRMRAGGKARVACPPALAYGDHGAPPAIPPGAALDLELELVAVEPAAP
jgi:FKBP-type peptidyl-prolyl cis-trans isomerase FkpA